MDVAPDPTTKPQTMGIAIRIAKSSVDDLTRLPTRTILIVWLVAQALTAVAQQPSGNMADILGGTGSTASNILDYMENMSRSKGGVVVHRDAYSIITENEFDCHVVRNELRYEVVGGIVKASLGRTEYRCKSACDCATSLDSDYEQLRRANQEQFDRVYPDNGKCRDESDARGKAAHCLGSNSRSNGFMRIESNRASRTIVTSYEFNQR